MSSKNIWEMIIFRLRNITILKVELTTRYTRGYLHDQQIVNIYIRHYPHQMAMGTILFLWDNSPTYVYYHPTITWERWLFSDCDLLPLWEWIWQHVKDVVISMVSMLLMFRVDRILIKCHWIVFVSSEIIALYIPLDIMQKHMGDDFFWITKYCHIEIGVDYALYTWLSPWPADSKYLH